MSDLLLHGVLNMPPELWTGSKLDVIQRHGRYVEASQKIKMLEQQLEDCHAEIKLKRLEKMEYGLAFFQMGESLAHGDVQLRLPKIVADMQARLSALYANQENIKSMH